MYATLRTIVLGLICFTCGGCIWEMGGKASVDAFSVSDSYSYTRLDNGLEEVQEASLKGQKTQAAQCEQARRLLKGRLDALVRTSD